MRAAKRLVVLSGARTYNTYVASLAPALWYRMNELTGSVALNSGSLGAAYNGAYTSCTLAQAGKLGAASAVLFDGANSMVTVPAGAYANYPAVTVASLVKCNSAGESNIGAFWNINGDGGFNGRFAGSMSSERFFRKAATTSANTTVSFAFGTAWAWMFATYNDATDRKIHLYQGIGGAITDQSGTPIAAVGALADVSSQVLVLGNRTTQDLTLNGLYDEFLWFNGVLIVAQMQQIVRLTGV